MQVVYKNNGKRLTAAPSRFHWEVGRGNWIGPKCWIGKTIRGLELCVSASGGVWESEKGQCQKETVFAEVMTNDCLVSVLFSLN